MALSTLGPVGGDGGQPIENYQIPEGYRIREIHLLTTDIVEGIQFTITDGKGGKSMPIIGGQSDRHKSHFVFAIGHNEILTGISGRYGWFIDGLRIHTNRRISPLYGGHGGSDEFHFVVGKNEEVAGLVGRAGWFIDALGVIVKTRAPLGLSADLKSLQKIEGIGPRIASILAENGIPDLAALANSSVSQIQGILNSAGSRYRLADPTTWVEQAMLGAQNKWDELRALQGQLKAGRKS